MHWQIFRVVKKKKDHLNFNFMALKPSYSTEYIKMNMLISEFSSISNSKSVCDSSMPFKSCTGMYMHFYRIILIKNGIFLVIIYSIFHRKNYVLAILSVCIFAIVRHSCVHRVQIYTVHRSKKIHDLRQK